MAAQGQQPCATSTHHCRGHRACFLESHKRHRGSPSCVISTPRNYLETNEKWATSKQAALPCFELIVPLPSIKEQSHRLEGGVEGREQDLLLCFVSRRWPKALRSPNISAVLYCFFFLFSEPIPLPNFVSLGGVAFEISFQGGE